MVMHDVPINWRLAYRGLVAPRANLDFDIHSFTIHDSPLEVFLPLHPTLPILAIRDWLHEDGNNQCGYGVFGRYSIDPQRAWGFMFTGLMLEFFDEADACLFRLSWNAA
jgi:hypothetical protein